MIYVCVRFFPSHMLAIRILCVGIALWLSFLHHINFWESSAGVSHFCDDWGGRLECFSVLSALGVLASALFFLHLVAKGHRDFASKPILVKLAGK